MNGFIVSFAHNASVLFWFDTFNLWDLKAFSELVPWPHIRCEIQLKMLLAYACNWNMFVYRCALRFSVGSVRSGVTLVLEMRLRTQMRMHLKCVGLEQQNHLMCVSILYYIGKLNSCRNFPSHLLPVARKRPHLIWTIWKFSFIFQLFKSED